jgi:small subunit ribosomal protein S9
MSETETETDTAEFSGTYTSESSPAAAAGRESAIGPAAATGRRKEAIARVRLVPGTGAWSVNG